MGISQCYHESLCSPHLLFLFASWLSPHHHCAQTASFCLFVLQYYRDWTQDLLLGKCFTSWIKPLVFFLSVCFSDRILCFYPGQPWPSSSYLYFQSGWDHRHEWPCLAWAASWKLAITTCSGEWLVEYLQNRRGKGSSPPLWLFYSVPKQSLPDLKMLQLGSWD
jgi:hypothetical protein